MNRHIYLDSSPEGTALTLTYEEEHNCKVVYKKVGNTERDYAFAGLWHPENEYSDEHIIIPLRSSYGGTIDYQANDIFANIIGSEPDRKKSKVTSWLGVFRKLGIPCTTCATDGNFYDPSDKTGNTGFDKKCSCDMVGGHVTNSFENKKTEDITGDIVYLLPICKHHNSYCTDDTGDNGSGFYMMPKTNGKAVKLIGYFEDLDPLKPFPQDIK